LGLDHPYCKSDGAFDPEFHIRHSGKCNISINACREMMPDPAFYAECLNESFNEMLLASTHSDTANKEKSH